MIKVKRTKEIIHQELKNERLAIPIEENLSKIDRLFEKPRNFTKEELDEALLDGDDAKLTEYRACKAKCHAKRDRLKAELEAAADAEARDEIMCKVTADPDAEY
jgi:hypothetical protein